MTKSDLLFLAVLAVVPVQLGKFFFFEYSFVLGIPIDYRAISVYFGDLVILSYFIVFVFENVGSVKKILNARKGLIWVFFVFNLYLFTTSSLFSISAPASLWFSLKFLEFSLLAIFASISFSRLKSSNLTSVVFIFSILWHRQ